MYFLMFKFAEDARTPSIRGSERLVGDIKIARTLGSLN